MLHKKKIVLFIFCIMVSVMMFSTKVFAATTERISGNDRYDTALQVSKNNWDKSPVVVLATGKDFPDALCAAPLAKKYDAPILLVEGTTLEGKIEQELQRLKAQTIFIVGGKGIISQNVEDRVKSMGMDPVRIYGQDRYETSMKIAEKIGTSSKLIVATGNNFPDALSIAPIAGIEQIPILLSEKEELPAIVKQYIDANNVTSSYVIGGTGVIGDAVLNQLPNGKRIYGANRYATNLAILTEFADNLRFNTAYIATGENYPDALAGSALAAKSSSPVFLVGQTASVEMKNYVNSKIPVINKISILGGYGAVPSQTIQNLLPQANFKIMIDAGHGGYDSGAVGPSGVKEKDVTLAVALKLGKILESQGIQVVYTRQSDAVSWPANEGLDLKARVDMADKANVDYFVSIHINSYPAPTANGTETYYDDGSVKGQALATSIHNEIIKDIGLTNRGVKTANYYVLKNTQAPAVLVELAFVSNPNEEKLLNNPDYQSKWANSIGTGILKFLGK